MMVLTSTGHAKVHVCLDGQEPPSFVYFEAFGGNPYHQQGDETHHDRESDPVAELMSGKLPQSDTPCILLAYALILPDPAQVSSQIPTFPSLFPYHSPLARLQQPRAPPFLA